MQLSDIHNLPDRVGRITARHRRTRGLVPALWANKESIDFVPDVSDYTRFKLGHGHNRFSVWYRDGEDEAFLSWWDAGVQYWFVTRV